MRAVGKKVPHLHPKRWVSSFSSQLPQITQEPLEQCLHQAAHRWSPRAAGSRGRRKGCAQCLPLKYPSPTGETGGHGGDRWLGFSLAPFLHYW